MSTPKPTLPPILRQGTDTAALTFSFLETNDLSSLSRTCKSSINLLNKTMIQKRKASELLTYIFNAESIKVKEFLAHHPISYSKSSKEYLPSVPSMNPCLVFSRSRCKEGYYSQKLKRRMTKRLWKTAGVIFWAFDLDDVDFGFALYNGCDKTDHSSEGETQVFVGAWLGGSRWSLQAVSHYEINRT